MALTLSGTEELTIEVNGLVPKERGKALAGGLPVEVVHGQVPVSLLLMQVKGLKPDGVLAPGMNYGEALWRVGVMLHGVPSWFGLMCDIDNAIVRKSGGWLVRYPVRPAKFHFEGSQARGAVDFTAVGNRCAVFASPTTAEAPEPEPPRRIVV